VRNAASQGANGLHFLHLPHLRFQLFADGNVAEDRLNRRLILVGRGAAGDFHVNQPAIAPHKLHFHQLCVASVVDLPDAVSRQGMILRLYEIEKGDAD